MIFGKGRLTLRSYTVFGADPTPDIDVILENFELYRFDGFKDNEGVGSAPKTV